MKIDLQRFTGPCSCGQVHEITVQGVYIESDASRYLDEILQSYAQPIFICDTNTRKAAASKLHAYYEKHRVIEFDHEDVYADNQNVQYLSDRLDHEADILVAVGAGTIHDLTRFVAHERGIPFLSVPTAASVDGYVSTVAAMTWNGMKKTMTATAPLYVLADTDIFGQAPYRLTASGISDLMAKYTALTDWKISHILTDEYLCPVIYELELEAVQEVERNLTGIHAGDPHSLEKLMYALLLSGLAMQMIGNSRPASGAEHHISHLWEMNVINPPLDALHGEKVSVGLLLSLEKYEEILRAIENGTCSVIDQRAFETELLKDTFGRKGLYEEVLAENGDNLLDSIDLKRLEERLDLIAEELRKLPRYHDLRRRLKAAGCVTTMEELILPESLKQLSLTISPYVRRRLTLMRLSKLLRY